LPKSQSAQILPKEFTLMRKQWKILISTQMMVMLLTIQNCLLGYSYQLSHLYGYQQEVIVGSIS